MKPTHIAIYVLAAWTAWTVSPAPAQAQCADWLTQGVGIHEAGYVTASTIWDPDGPGSQPPLLVVGGFFDQIGGVTANNIAAWDGEVWQPLGAGIDPPGEVRSLAVFNGELVAGGHFFNAGGTPAAHIARWNGNSWQPLGAGFGPANFADVYALIVYNGELIAGGDFNQAGGVNTPFIAAWNASTWHGLGGGVGGIVYSMAVFNNELVVGGLLLSAGGPAANHIARWNGATWQTLESGLTGTSVNVEPAAYSMLVVGNSLIVGGQFTTAGGVPANSIAAWNGSSWSALGVGITGGIFPYVAGLALLGGQLHAGGTFTTAGGAPASNIARWNGSAWSTLGGGLTSAPPTGAAAYTLTTFDNMVFVGGYFLGAGGTPARSVARWNGSAWLSEPGANVSAGDIESTLQFVDMMVPWAGRLVIGGDFATTDNGSQSYSSDIAVFDGVDLSSLGNTNGWVAAGTTGPGFPQGVELVVGGSFTNIGGTAASMVARRNSIGFGFWGTMGPGFNSTVLTLERVGGTYVAGGVFTQSGATTVNRVAFWNESTDTWSQLQGGMNSSVWSLHTFMQQDPPPFPVLRRFLVAGGDFTTAGGVAASRIAICEQSLFVGGGFSAWQPMGAGFNNSVNAIQRFNGSTYAAGSFTASGATPLNRIARWNGSAWVDVGGGVNGIVKDLIVSNGTLVAGGVFTTAGGVPAPRIARWDGTSWSAIGNGTDFHVIALNTFQNEIVVGGTFERVSNQTVYSPYWARFSEDGVPWIAQQTIAQTVACEGEASFSVETAAGYDELSYQWRKDGVAVVPGPTGTGSTIVANDEVLTILAVGLADEGTYDCVVSNGCGSATSTGASLTATGCPPPGDMNCNGALNSTDVSALVLALTNLPAYQQQFPACNPLNGDMNHDTLLNGSDIGLFVNCLINGGCP